MFSYPSIPQFRNVVRNVEYDNRKESVDFIRTTKIHGSNCSIVLDLQNNTLSTQSRNRVITPENDYRCFAKFVQSQATEIIETMGYYFISREGLKTESKPTHLIFYGEWCGKGIQKGTAINNLKKMFIVFDACLVVDDELIFDTNFHVNGKNILSPNADIYSISNIDSNKVALNFSNPKSLQKSLFEDVLKAENECPVGKWFGVAGTGEGYVYTSVCGNYKFKVKGEKHSVSNSKVRTPEELEQLKNVVDFVQSVVLESRLEQGVDYLKEMKIPIDSISTGVYIKWVNEDVLKEEGDLIAELGLDKTIVNKEVSRLAGAYFKQVL